MVGYSDPVSAEVLEQGANIVVDCTDNLATRQLLNSYCYQHAVALVSASAISWEAQLIGFDFNSNRRLCYNCIIDQSSGNPALDCANSGVVGPVLGAMGSLQAIMVIQLLLGRFKQYGEMQRYNAKAGYWLSLTAKAKPNCAICGME